MTKNFEQQLEILKSGKGLHNQDRCELVVEAIRLGDIMMGLELAKGLGFTPSTKTVEDGVLSAITEGNIKDAIIGFDFLSRNPKHEEIEMMLERCVQKGDLYELLLLSKLSTFFIPVAIWQSCLVVFVAKILWIKAYDEEAPEPSKLTDITSLYGKLFGNFLVKILGRITLLNLTFPLYSKSTISQLYFCCDIEIEDGEQKDFVMKIIKMVRDSSPD